MSTIKQVSIAELIVLHSPLFYVELQKVIISSREILSFTCSNVTYIIWYKHNMPDLENKEQSALLPKENTFLYEEKTSSRVTTLIILAGLSHQLLNRVWANEYFYWRARRVTSDIRTGLRHFTNDRIHCFIILNSTTSL